MACQAARRSKVLLARTIHPESKEVINTYCRFRGVETQEVGFKDGQVDLKDLEEKLTGDVAAVLVQSPNFFGVIESLQEIGDLAHKNKSLFIVSVDPISLAILKPPGELGADIVVGEGQSLGNPLNFGGPYLGFLAATDKLMRKCPAALWDKLKTNPAEEALCSPYKPGSSIFAGKKLLPIFVPTRPLTL